MAINDFSTNGKTNSSSFVLKAPVQSLKDCKDAVQIFFVKSNPVVRNLNFKCTPWILGHVHRLSDNLNDRSGIWLMKLQSVANQVLKKPWPVWTLAHLPKHVVAPRIAAMQERQPQVHFAVTVLWSFLESWVAEHWTKRPLP